MPTHSNAHGRRPTWLAPTPMARQRVLERGSTLDRVTRINGAVIALVLLATAIFRDARALLPLCLLLAAIAFAPLAVRRGARPEYTELMVGGLLTIAMAATAGLTGGTGSPLAYLLPLGVVMNALRAGPASVAAEAAITAIVLVAATLLTDAAAVGAEPLPMIAILVSLGTVTLAAIALVDAEIGYRDASAVDRLTGLLNRHTLEERFEELRQQAVLADAPICLVLFDLDHFKQVNDGHGHDAGDRLLREVAYEVRKQLRKFELVYRIGGEEFLVVLPGLTVGEGEETAERLRAAVATARLGDGTAVSASFGVSGDRGADIDFDRLYREADEALYGAKRSGRDRVGTSGRPDATPVA